MRPVEKQTVKLDPIRYVSLTDSVYQSIKQRILSNEIALGSRIRDEELAAQLGVSRTPVREAIQILIRDGLVQVFPRSQTRVRTLSEHDIEEIFDLRIALETLAVRKASERFNSEQVSKLRAMHHAAELALKAGHVAPALEFDRELHRMILDYSGNDRLKEMMATINDYVTLFRNVGALTPAHRGFNYRHKEIVRALERQDPEAAAKALGEHILMAKEQTQRDFEQQNLVKANSQVGAKA